MGKNPKLSDLEQMTDFKAKVRRCRIWRRFKSIQGDLNEDAAGCSEKQKRGPSLRMEMHRLMEDAVEWGWPKLFETGVFVGRGIAASCSTENEPSVKNTADAGDAADAAADAANAGTRSGVRARR